MSCWFVSTQHLKRLAGCCLVALPGSKNLRCRRYSVGQTRPVLFGLCLFGFVVLGLLREVLPLAPPIKVDERLHTSPLHDLTFQPDEVYGLSRY